MNRKFFCVSNCPDASLPARSTLASAGYDLSCYEETTIQPKENKLVRTGIKAEFPSDEVLLVFARSSLFKKKKLMLANSVGVIDSDYFNNEANEGEILINLVNMSDSVVTLEKDERIAQAIFVKFLKTDDDETDSVRKGGYGSTGK